MKINILDKKIYNRIAAGEVVERPFSVVKELVENSIDAGAKNITISIWNGGKDLVEITDDGCGIEKEELPKAFLPHATSKISDVSDLDNIITLGFRGEALASIASVAKVAIVSKPEKQLYGAKITADGGNIGEVEDAPSDNGIKISVESLFYNTPVRAKFLKTTRAEEADITNIVSRLILANPYISFKYYADDELILQSYGGGEEEAMIAVYGVDTVRNCFHISAEKNGIGIRGYIGRHNFTKANRTYQTLIINGRYVINSTVSSAIQNAYQSYLMKRQYPFFVLELTIPAEAVDVNVHPNKTDVRFSNNQVVYGTVYSVVSKVLDGSNEALDIVMENPAAPVSPIFESVAKTDNSDDKNVKNEEFSSDFVDEKNTEIKTNYKKEKRARPLSNQFWEYSAINDSGVSTCDSAAEQKIISVFNENKKYLEELEKKAGKEKPAEVFEFEKTEEKTSELPKSKADAFTEQGDMGIDYDFIYVGQALKTYLIFEKNGDVYFIDQHAAHERILFDSIYEKALSKNSATQPLLIPYILNLNSVEDAYFQTRTEYLKELGFAIEEFGGNSYKVTEVPLDLAEMNLDEFFSDVLNDNGLKQEKVPEVIREKLCQRACKAAIKAGFSLSDGEIKALIKKMNGDMGLKCPHGRPVAVRITGTEIEKWFKRIV